MAAPTAPGFGALPAVCCAGANDSVTHITRAAPTVGGGWPPRGLRRARTRRCRLRAAFAALRARGAAFAGTPPLPAPPGWVCERWLQPVEGFGVVLGDLAH